MARFPNRPKSREARLWLQFTLKSGDQFEGTVHNDMLSIVDDLQFGAISYLPPYKRYGQHKPQVIGVELLEKIEVLGIINGRGSKIHARIEDIQIRS